MKPVTFHQQISWLPDIAVAAGLFVVAVAVALVAHYFLTRLLRRLTEARLPSLYRMTARTGNVTRLAAVLLAMHVVLPALPLNDAADATLHNVLIAGFIGLVGWVIAVTVDIWSERYMRRFRIDVADNLQARKFVTQMKVLRRIAEGAILVVTLAFALMVFPEVRDFGVSLFASAGVAGIVAGLAARPVLENLLAGVQIALTQPIRIDDAVVVEGEWGRIEEINSTYIVVKLWDLRRLVVPLAYFMDHPFQNWTRTSATVIGSVILHLDYTAPVSELRRKAEEIVRASRLWDSGVVNVQVTDATESTMELRVLATASTGPRAFDLRCEIREKLIAFIQAEYPQALPRQRNEQRVIQPDTVYPPEPERRTSRPRTRAEAAE